MFRQGKQAVKKPAQQNVVIIYADDLLGILDAMGAGRSTPRIWTGYVQKD